MTPKEKAEELFNSYYNYVSGWTSTSRPDEYPSAVYEGQKMRVGRAKECAFIAVDEIISACEYNNVEIYNTTWWNKVKDEINNL